MARRPRLNGLRPATRLLALVALVLLVHAVALDWLWRQVDRPSALRPLATPMFTRLLQQQAAAPPAPPAAPPPVRPRRPAITSVAKGQNPAPPARPASAPDASTSASPPAVHEEEAPAAATTPHESSATAAVAPASQQPASAPATASLDTWPADTRLSYRLRGHFRGELQGSARVQWQRQDNQYQTRVEIDLAVFVSMVLTSQGEVTPGGLLPRMYEELRRGGPRIARMGDDAIVLNDGRKLPRPPGVQDTASQFVDLSHRFATGQEMLAVGRSVSFWMARPGGVDLWTYDVVEREILQSPELGPIEAFRLKPRPIANPRGNITAEMWFAPSLQYLPVRIRVSMGDEAHVDLMVVKIEQR